MTYRGSPMDDATASLLTTMGHSALGTRWIYLATSDPVGIDRYVSAPRSRSVLVTDSAERAAAVPCKLAWSPPCLANHQMRSKLSTCAPAPAVGHAERPEPGAACAVNNPQRPTGYRQQHPTVVIVACATSRA